MKALSMLDHVMLWLARCFAVTLALFLAFWSWEVYTDSDLKIVYEATHNPHDYIVLAATAAYCGVWTCIWLICSWHKPTIVTRTLLGLSAGILAFWLIREIAFDSPIHTAIVLGMRLTIDILAGPVLLVLGSFSMAWLAVRPLANAPLCNKNNFPTFAKPQSS